MTTSPPGSAPVTPPPTRVALADGVVVVCDEWLFGPGGERLCERFLGRALSVDGVRSVSLDRSQGTAVVRHGAGPRDRDRLVLMLSAAIRDDRPSGAIPALPRDVWK